MYKSTKVYRYPEERTMRDNCHNLLFGFYMDDELRTIKVAPMFVEIMEKSIHGRIGAFLQIIKQTIFTGYKWGEPYCVSEFDFSKFPIKNGELSFWKDGTLLSIYQDHVSLRMDILNFMYRKLIEEGQQAVSDSEIISELHVPYDVLQPQILFLNQMGYLNGGDQWHKLTAEGLIKMEPESPFSKNLKQIDSKIEINDSHQILISIGDNNSVSQTISVPNSIESSLENLINVIRNSDYEDKEIHIEAVEDAKNDINNSKSGKLKIALQVLKNFPDYFKSCQELVQNVATMFPDLPSWWHKIIGK